ncbi:hypothetical protein JMJ55_16235 [Belnapia sp. T6]|uniref:Uncharacterized protein n=1 Tax=Belnapia mucosa TaxID=2804532 RepID=A0ABS1V5B6_9PROT|nr:hypothetical protein [Belnapia mucosa]MBL6456887.1 hypothetical protein [Belnapia mucosa]
MRRHRSGAVWLLAWVPFALAGCSVPKQVNPIEIYRTVSGEADAGRPPPPGMDRPRPNLASIPPRPERPPPEVRDAISAALAASREQSRTPLPPRAVPAGPVAASPGDPPIPAAPPPRPSLAGAPAVPWSDAPRRAAPGSPAGRTQPEPEAPPPPSMPDAAPAPPPPDLLGPPPLPRL